MYRFGWFYGFFCLIVLATYTASLASFFVLSAAPPASAGVDDLRRDGVPFAVVRGSTAATFFDQPAYAARVNMVQVGTFGEGMLQVSIFSCFFCFKKKKKGIAGVRNGSWTGFVSTRIQLEYFANQPPVR